MLETFDELTQEQVDEITKWFDKNIGTEYEVNPSASGEENEFYIVFFDLEGDEWKKLEDFLDNKGVKYYG